MAKMTTTTMAGKPPPAPRGTNDSKRTAPAGAMDDGSDSVSVRTLVVAEFDAFQEERRERAAMGLEEDADDIDSGTEKQEEYEGSIDRRVVRIRAQLRKIDDCGDEDNEEVDDLVSTLQHVLDCALAATDIGSGASATTSAGPAYWTMDLLAALLASLLCDNNNDDDSDSNAIVLPVLKRAVDYTTVLLERIRSAALYVLGRFARSFLHQQNDNASNNKKADTVVLDLLASAVVSRITDKSTKVRQAAVMAGRELAGEDRDVLTCLVFAAQHDPSATTRALAVRNLPVHELASLEAWVSRLRDVSPAVRVAAADRLASTDLDPTAWDAELRAAAVQAGLSQQRCAATKRAAGRIVDRWIAQADHDPLRLLEQMQVTQYEAQSIVVARRLLEAAYGNDNDGDGVSLQQLQRGVQRAVRQVALVPPPNDKQQDGDDGCLSAITAEGLVWSRAVCEYASTNNENAQCRTLADQVVPDVPYLCQVLERHLHRLVCVEQDNSDGDDEDNADNTTSSTIRRTSTTSSKASTAEEDLLLCKCVQLLQLIPGNNTDLEEGSRRHLVAFLKDVLISLTTPEDLVEPCLQVLLKQSSSSSSSSSGANNGAPDVILDLLATLSQEQQTHKASGSALEENHWVRLLSILSVVGERPDVAPRVFAAGGGNNQEEAEKDASSSSSSPQQFILEALQHSSDMVRQLAVTCLGQLGLWTADKALVQREWQPLLLSKASADSNETSEIQSQALLALSDWAMVDPSGLLSPQEDDDGGRGGLAALVSDRLMVECSSSSSKSDDGSDDQLGLCLAAEIAAKLVLQFHRQYPAICGDWMPYLVTLFFDAQIQQQVDDEEHQDDLVLDVGSPSRLQQLLSIFFPALCLSGGSSSSDGMNGSRLLLESMGDALLVMTQKKRRKAWPFAKMIAYLGDTVRRAQDEQQPAKVDEGKDAVDQAQEGEHVDDEEGKPAASTSDSNSIPISLVTAVQITRFLSQAPNTTATVQRTLCKLAAVLPLDDDDDEEEEDIQQHDGGHNAKLWLSLWDQIEEFEANIDDDATCLQAVRQIRAMLPERPALEEKVGGAAEESDDDDDDEETETEEEDDDVADDASEEDTASLADEAATPRAIIPDKENDHNRDTADDELRRLSTSTTKLATRGSMESSATAPRFGNTTPVRRRSGRRSDD